MIVSCLPPLLRSTCSLVHMLLAAAAAAGNSTKTMICGAAINDKLIQKMHWCLNNYGPD